MKLITEKSQNGRQEWMAGECEKAKQEHSDKPRGILSFCAAGNDTCRLGRSGKKKRVGMESKSWSESTRSTWQRETCWRVGINGLKRRDWKRSWTRGFTSDFRLPPQLASPLLSRSVPFLGPSRGIPKACLLVSFSNFFLKFLPYLFWPETTKRPYKIKISASFYMVLLLRCQLGF